MKQLNQKGSLNTLLIPLILITLFFIVAASLAGWAYTSRQDYKDHSDVKVSAAVAIAKTENSAVKDKEFLEKEKLPFHQYNGPSPFGSLQINYPKTWSAYVSETANSSTPIDAYFHPKFVPSITSNASYALRVQVSDISYNATMATYNDIIKTGKLTATPYIPAQERAVTGVRLDGQITPIKQGAMVVLPLRDKTLRVWTESADFTNDFNNNILPNFSFDR